MPPTLPLSPPHALLSHLRSRWGVFVVLAALFLGTAYPLAQALWSSPYPLRWLLLAVLGNVYLFSGLWRNLKQNHRPDEVELLPTFGLGNALSIVRGILMMAFLGFLFQPWPGGGALDDWRAWAPGILYTIAALPDYVDGYFARVTNHVTKLGEWLDMTLDSVGVFTATLLAVQYGTIPWWYLPVGLARYLFLAGIWLRERRGLPVYDLPSSNRRRGFAALKMGFIFVILLPPFRPPATHLAAAVFGIPFAIAFLWDWFIVSGALSPDAGDRYPLFKKITLRWLPLLLRGLAILLILPQIALNIQKPFLRPLAVMEIAVTLLLAFGIWPRTTAIVASGLITMNQLNSPLTINQYALVVTYISMIFLGTGAYSLWPFEERLIERRPGDR
jgi:CDP-diacylglycerol---glycerol-3-phosphate 3-phosphatidyltransferase